MKVARALPWAVALGIAMLAVGAVVPSVEPLIELVLAPVLCAALLTSSLVLCVLRARATPSEAGTWYALASGIALWMTGELIRSSFFPEGAAFPAVYDLFYLSFVPVAGFGLARLVHGRVRSFGRSMVLDGAITAGAVGAVLTAIMVPLMVDAPDAAAAFHNFVYLIGDSVLVGILVGALAISGWRPAPDMAAVTAGLGLFLVADVAFVLAAGQGISSSLWIGIGWVAGQALLGTAAMRQGERRATVRYGVGMFLVPLASTIVAIGLLVAGSLGLLTPLASVIAAGVLVLAIVRTAVTFRENARLTLSRHQAVTDELTGLANRRGLTEQLAAAFGGDAARPVGLLLIDLDRFKELNDTLGHDVGDRMLAELGPRLEAAAPDGAVVARLGGDEFAVLVTRSPTRVCLAHAAAAIQDSLETPFLLDGLSLRTYASIGGALAPDDAADAKGLLRSADVAMYAAKRARLPYEPYRAERDKHSRNRLALSEELRRGILGGELEVHYQPKASLESGEIIGVEALVRWRHPVHGLLYPDAFIDLAEESGVMRELSRDVLRLSLEQTARWRAAGHDLSVAANLSMADLLDPMLSDEVASLLEDTGVPASRVVLEITENVAMADPERVLDVLRSLQSLGVGLSLDDFGTGYSSLAYLKRLPVEELKIDRSFVMRMVEDPEDAVIVRATIDLGRALGLRVVAEGVESHAAWNALRDFGCDVVQGYHLSRPLPASGLEPLLAATRTSAAA